METVDGNSKISIKYKLVNVNSHKKNFDTLDELNEHINKHNLRPNNGSNSIKYEIINTITTTEKIDVNYPKLSEEMGIKLLVAIRDMIIRDEDSLITPYFLKITDKSSRTWWSKELSHLSRSLDNGVNTRDAMVDYINYLILNYKTLDLKAVKGMTDYKPCNGYGFYLGNMYLLLRQDTVLFDSHYLCGRNVNERGRCELIDDDLKKILK